MEKLTRKSSCAHKTLRYQKAARLFAKLKGRSTIDLDSMKKGLAARRGISTQWMFKKIRHSEKKNAFWQRRDAYYDFMDRIN